MRKPFTVTNIRPRVHVRVGEKTLAPQGTGRTSQTDLTLEELLSTAAVHQIAAGRIKVIRGDVPPELTQAVNTFLTGMLPLTSEATPPSSEVAAPAAVALEEASEVLGDESEGDLSETSEDEIEDGGDEPLADAEISEPAEVDAVVVDEAPTAEKLSEYTAAELQEMLKERDLPTSGRKAELVERLLAALTTGA